VLRERGAIPLTRPIVNAAAGTLNVNSRPTDAGDSQYA
jgi:hypothetical protein